MGSKHIRFAASMRLFAMAPKHSPSSLFPSSKTPSRRAIWQNERPLLWSSELALSCHIRRQGKPWTPEITRSTAPVEFSALCLPLPWGKACFVITKKPSALFLECWAFVCYVSTFGTRCKRVRSTTNEGPPPLGTPLKTGVRETNNLHLSRERVNWISRPWISRSVARWR